MANYADTEAYAEAIQALKTFSATVQEEAGSMADRADECVENCENDEASLKSQEQVHSYVSAFYQTAEAAQRTAAAMEKELEAIREAAAKAQA